MWCAFLARFFLMLSQVRSAEKTKSNTEHPLHIPSSAASTPNDHDDHEPTLHHLPVHIYGIFGGKKNSI
jgi:hypothetical protein